MSLASLFRKVMPEPDPLADFSADELQAAALKMPNVYAAIRRPSDSFWGGRDFRECDACQARADAVRAQYATYEPRRMRNAILDWMDYADRHIAEVREDIRTQATRRRMDAYRAEQEAKGERHRELLATLGTLRAPSGGRGEP